MKIRVIVILSLCFLVTGMVASAQFDPSKVCRMEDGKLIFRLDKRWTAAQRKEIARIYDLDSAVMVQAFQAKPLIREGNDTWTTRKVDANCIELSKEQGKAGNGRNTKDKIFLLEDNAVDRQPAADRESEPFGVNRLTRNTVMQISRGTVRFFLPGYQKARSVYLSGSFNGWSTGKDPMKSCDSGWITTLKLLPGRYTYKFIVDGKWMNDPFNRLKDDDTYGGYNSVFFCYNFRFALQGYQDAKNVVVTGSFNNWDPRKLRMIRYRGSWILPLYLREGTHSYKFIVDKEWITDPANRFKLHDGNGNVNSYIGFGDTVVFRLKGYPQAKKVCLSGNFNGWNPDELLMEKTEGGWQIPFVLAAGNYQYKFVVDGEWILDPGNPYTAGEGGFYNSFIPVKPNYQFVLKQNSRAKKVFLAGSFNGWDRVGFPMVERDGNWYFPIYLRPGKYTYKFFVDGKWILDPVNDTWEENEYGTGNSVLWIEP